MEPKRAAPAEAVPATPGAPADSGAFPELAEMEKRHILAALDKAGGNRTHAARMLNISIRTLRNKLHEYYGTLPRGDAEEEAVSEG